MLLLKKYWPVLLAIVIVGGYLIAQNRLKTAIDYEQTRSDAAAMAAIAGMSAASDTLPRPAPTPAPTPLPTPGKPLNVPKVSYVQSQLTLAEHRAEQGAEVLFPDLAKLKEPALPEQPQVCPLKPETPAKAPAALVQNVPPKIVPQASTKSPPAPVSKPVAVPNQQQNRRGWWYGN